MKYDLVIHGGEVIDPAANLHEKRDIAVREGKVASIGPRIDQGESARVIDARGKLVTPGLIDLHAHVSEGITGGGTDPDKAGVSCGVTAVCDAGSTGYSTFPGFKRYVINRARTDVFCFLHMCPFGHAVVPETWNWININQKAMLDVIHSNHDTIKGLKMRVIERVVKVLGADGVSRSKKIAAEAGLPLMVHLGLDSPATLSRESMDDYTGKILPFLGKGDILSHVYTWKEGGVISAEGRVLPQLKEAMHAGVVLDTAIDRSNWSFDLARRALDQGILPSTISTDVSLKSIDGPVFSLPVTMSKFLAAGLSLDQVIRMTTINPALALGEAQRRGSMGVGMPADMAILEIKHGDFWFEDGVPGKTFRGNALITPVMTLKAGAAIEAGPRFRSAVVAA